MDNNLIKDGIIKFDSVSPWSQIFDSFILNIIVPERFFNDGNSEIGLTFCLFLCNKFCDYLGFKKQLSASFVNRYVFKRHGFAFIDKPDEKIIPFIFHYTIFFNVIQ